MKGYFLVELITIYPLKVEISRRGLRGGDGRDEREEKEFRTSIDLQRYVDGLRRGSESTSFSRGSESVRFSEEMKTEFPNLV